MEIIILAAMLGIILTNIILIKQNSRKTEITCPEVTLEAFEMPPFPEFPEFPKMIEVPVIVDTRLDPELVEKLDSAIEALREIAAKSPPPQTYRTSEPVVQSIPIIKTQSAPQLIDGVPVNTFPTRTMT